MDEKQKKDDERTSPFVVMLMYAMAAMAGAGVGAFTYVRFVADWAVRDTAIAQMDHHTGYTRMAWCAAAGAFCFVAFLTVMRMEYAMGNRRPPKGR